MKKLSNLKGVKALNKSEQKAINGGDWRRRCTGTGRQCCLTTPSGFEFCDAGICLSNGSCFWF